MFLTSDIVQCKIVTLDLTAGGGVPSKMVCSIPRRGVLKKVLYGEALPRGPSLTLLYTIFSKRHPFHIPFIGKRHPFHILFIGKRHPFHIPSKEDLGINR